MTRKKISPRPEHYGDATVPAFGYELIRSMLIPELLGKETASILYWSGRKLARSYPLDTTEQIISFFDQAGWGYLEQKETKKHQMTFECTSSLVASRITNDPDPGIFSLEAGFLAEQIQRQNGCVAEAQAEIKTGRLKRIIFSIQWDSKDSVGILPAAE